MPPPPLAGPNDHDGAPHRRTVLVTGASSGIGRATALEMAERGWRVLAGVRRPIDGEGLAQAAMAAGAAGQVEWMTLDLLRPEDIAGAADHVTAITRGAGLDGLVNSARMKIGPCTMASVGTGSDLLALTQAWLRLSRLK